MDQRMSMAWSQHWLLAIPIFLGAAFYLTQRWPRWQWWPVVLSVSLGVLLGQVVEPVAEVVLYGDTLRDVYEPARVRAFIEFLAAGLLTLVPGIMGFWRRSTRPTEIES